jgi:hypothetical protein
VARKPAPLLRQWNSRLRAHNGDDRGEFLYARAREDEALDSASRRARGPLGPRRPTSAYSLSLGVCRRRADVERALRNDASFVREPGKHGAWTLTSKAQKAAESARDALQAAERAEATIHVPPRRNDVHAPSES